MEVSENKKFDRYHKDIVPIKHLKDSKGQL